jgi:beta-lactamase regulating signal transducer with metallopeptidase domain
MSSLGIVQLYLAIAGVMAGSYLVLGLLQQASSRFGFKVSSRSWLVLAQTIFVASLFSPIVLTAIPSKRKAVIEFKAFHPLSEGDGLAQASRSDSSRHSLTVQQPNVFPESTTSPLTQIAYWIKDSIVEPFSFYGAILLLICALVGIARFYVGFSHLKRTLKSSVRLHRVKKIEVAVSSEIAIPFSAWIGGTNWIVLPQAFLGKKSDLKLALKHELQHHRVGDTRWVVLLDVLAGIFFLNPMIHCWKKKITEFQEFSCDEALLGRRRVSARDYGSCLVRVAEAALEIRQVYVGTTCMGADFKNPFKPKSFLRRRIEMFRSHEGRTTYKWSALVFGTLALGFTVAFAFGADQLIRVDQKGVNPGVVRVDQDIQAIAERALKDTVANHKAKGGFAIVADPNTGRILAIAEADTTGKLPTYWSLQQILEPASLAKTLVAAQAMELGLTTPQEKISCENGNYRFGDRVYHDWKTNGWNHLTTEETITNSSDICTMKLGEKVGADGLGKMLVAYGFGPEGTARSFPKARVGLLPPQKTPLWPEMVPAVSAGYGFKATPIELIQAYGAFANGGNLLTPKLADDASPPQIIRRVLSAENSEKTKEILRQVVLKGTGKGQASSALYSTAGKTATSYIPDLTQWELVEGKKKGNFAGFLGFAPVKNPRIEVYVGILDPNDGDKSGAHGSVHAGPTFKRIVEEVLQKLNVAPDQT